MGRASNRKWSARVARFVQYAGSPHTKREAADLLTQFGQAAQFRRARAALNRQLGKLRAQVAA